MLYRHIREDCLQLTVFAAKGGSSGLGETALTEKHFSICSYLWAYRHGSSHYIQFFTWGGGGGTIHLPCLVSELEIVVSLFVFWHNTIFNVSVVFMGFWKCVCARVCVWEREFTNSTPRCLVGEVNTAEKMTESTRCLWNGARHGHRHEARAQTTTLAHMRKRQDTKKGQTSQSSKQIEYMHTAAHTQTHGRRWWTVKLQSPSISVSIFPSSWPAWLWHCQKG